MSYQYVIYEKKEHIAYVTINRPEVMNALHYDANVELSQVFNDFKQDDQAWVAIFTGAGQKAFSAGNDLKATAAATARGEKPTLLSVPFGGITSGFQCDKPIIAAVNGFALMQNLSSSLTQKQYAHLEGDRGRARGEWLVCDYSPLISRGYGSHAA